VTAASAR